MPFFTAFAIIELTSAKEFITSLELLFLREISNLFTLVLILVNYWVLTAFLTTDCTDLFFADL